MIVVGGLATFQNHVLMGKRPDDKMRPAMWEYPGGKVDPGETNEQALKREWKEELHVDIVVGELIGVVSFIVEEPIVWWLYHVTFDGDDEPRNSAHAELAWVNPETAVRFRACTPTTYLIYRDVVRFMQGRR